MAIVRHAKHWLVPHRRNDHRPHLIRGRGLAVMAGLLVAVQVLAYATAPASVRVARAQSGSVLAYASGNITPSELLAGTNQARVAAGLPALRMDSRLNASAQAKAQNMFAEDYWAHVSPSGLQPWYWFTQAGYRYSYAGENLAKDFDTSAGTMDGWLNSPGHRANILNANYVDVGFAVVNGTLVGGQTTLVVAHYGQTVAAPAPAIAVAKPAPTPAPPAVVRTPVPAAPVATPVATSVPTPVPTAAATPTPLAESAPVVASFTESAPAPRGYSLFQPLALTRTLTWPSLVTLGLLLLLLVVYLYTHMTVWRKGLKRWQSSHYRGLAVLQVGGVTAAMLMLIASSFGRVG